MPNPTASPCSTCSPVPCPPSHRLTLALVLWTAAVLLGHPHGRVAVGTGGLLLLGAWARLQGDDVVALAGGLGAVGHGPDLAFLWKKRCSGVVMPAVSLERSPRGHQHQCMQLGPTFAPGPLLPPNPPSEGLAGGSAAVGRLPPPINAHFPPVPHMQVAQSPSGPAPTPWPPWQSNPIRAPDTPSASSRVPSSGPVLLANRQAAPSTSPGRPKPATSSGQPASAQSHQLSCPLQSST